MSTPDKENNFEFDSSKKLDMYGGILGGLIPLMVWDESWSYRISVYFSRVYSSLPICAWNWFEYRYSSIACPGNVSRGSIPGAVSYTHLRAHETRHDLVCRLLLEKK